MVGSVGIDLGTLEKRFDRRLKCCLDAWSGIRVPVEDEVTRISNSF